MMSPLRWLTSRRIRIIAAPPGEAPREIREAWVGCVLPVFAKSEETRFVGYQRLGVLSRMSEAYPDGYAVRVMDALRALSHHDEQAAQWWRENTPHLLQRGQLFLFPEEVCELL